ncbi:MAG TPA: UPF0175 family protein [Pricia sp.]|nr:UPF0175 family protein [Pricia sp.]
MKEYQIKIPESLKLGDFDLKMMVAAKLFEDGRLSSGQACQIVGISKRAFLEVLGKYGVSMFGYDFDELEEDLKNV